MVRKTVIALCCVGILATAFGSAADARRYDQRWWWHAYQQRLAGKHCIRGEESATSAYPSWMKC